MIIIKGLQVESTQSHWISPDSVRGRHLGPDSF